MPHGPINDIGGSRAGVPSRRRYHSRPPTQTMEQKGMEELEAVSEADYWAAKVRSIRRFTRRARDARAPYKPLLLLWLIGRLAGGQPAAVSFKDAELDLKLLMHRYRLGRSVRVAYPFVYLGQSPELWTVKDSSGHDVTSLPQSIKESPVFLRAEAVGTLAPEFELALHDPNVRSAVVNTLLHMEFPETLHEEILHEIGLGHLVAPALTRRDPNFKSTVLLAYEDRCSFCGFGGSLRGTPVGVDAAHVKMRSHSGPDRIDNGLALCALHHRLFDRGALGLNEDHRILVSQHMMLREDESPVPVKELVGVPMRLPQAGYDAPAGRFIKWHYRNLFVGPERPAVREHA